MKTFAISTTFQDDALVATMYGMRISEVSGEGSPLPTVASVLVNASKSLEQLLDAYSDIFFETVNGFMKIEQMSFYSSRGHITKGKLRRHSLEDILEINQQVERMAN